MSNAFVYFFKIILIISNVFSIYCDCGCNKIQRSEIEIAAKKSNTAIDSIFKIRKDSSQFCPQSQILSLMHEKMVKINGGDYLIGTSEPIHHSDRESQLETVYINDFFIDQYEVSNAQFNEFINNTGYVTHAEKFGDSFVFEGILSKSTRSKYYRSRVYSAPWWYKVNNTFWNQPEGAGSKIDNRMNHPVVHVSWFDAVAFCKWKNKRLPTEYEWEVACRGGKKNKLYPWGNKLRPGNQHWLNIWQGNFPELNTVEDGYFSTCPVDQFKQNDYHLYNMVGNVWEWTSSLWNNIISFPDDVDLEKVDRVKKGGSYLCHKSYCYRYRCAARSSNSADSSAGNLGFRCARS